MSISIESSKSTTSLTVKEATDLTSIQQVAKEWMELSKQRFRVADMYQYTETPKCTSKILDRLEDSKSIIDAIYKRITSKLEQNDSSLIKWTKALVCLDQNSKIQAIALINEETNKIVDIATHPNNIPSSLSDPAHQVRGAGTQIIMHLAKVALKTDCSILVDPNDSGKAFYKKLGFKKVELTTNFTLTADKIRELISSDTAPFNLLKGEV